MILRDVILCYGDSLTYGSRDNPEGRGYPSRLAPMIEMDTGKVCICLNKGITAETSIQNMCRAYDTFRSYPEAQLVLLMIGTNDLKSAPNPIFYSSNMRCIINMARLCNKTVLVGKLPPIKSMGMWCFPKNASEGVDIYNRFLEDLSISMKFQLVDFSDMGDYLCDGVHFSPEGYQEMARRWFHGIKELI